LLHEGAINICDQSQLAMAILIQNLVK